MLVNIDAKILNKALAKIQQHRKRIINHNDQVIFLPVTQAHLRSKISMYMCVVCVLVAQSCPTLCDPMTAAHQAPPSMDFSRQEYWSGLPFPSPGHLPDPGIKPDFSALAGNSLPPEPRGKPYCQYTSHFSKSNS